MTAPALGPGVRVWIGWCPDDRCHGDADVRLKTGTVDRGPVEPGEYFMAGHGRLKIEERAWHVDVDNGVHAVVAERDLYPVDGGNEVAREDIHERSTEAIT